MPQWHRNDVSGLDRPAGRRCSRLGADLEARTAHRNSSQLRSKWPIPSSNSPIRLRAMFEQIERLIETSALQWTFLPPGMFAAKALRWWAPQIRAGDVVRWPYLAAPTAPIDVRDIAAVAVRALCEDRHAGAEYFMTGSSITEPIRAGVNDRSRDRPLAPHRRDLARRGAA